MNLSPRHPSHRLLVALAVMALPAAGHADHHIAALATPMDVNTTLGATLQGGDNHYFELRIDSAGTLVVFTQSALDTYGELMTLQEQLITTANDGGNGGNFRLESAIGPGTYYVRVLSPDPFASGDFTLSNAFTAEGEAEQGNGAGKGSGGIVPELGLEVSLSGVRTFDGSQTSAILTAGSALSGSATPRGSFNVGENISIVGAVSPQVGDRGEPADIFVVIRTIIDGKSTWRYRDLDGVFQPWNTSVPDLPPAYEVEALGESEVVEIHSGTLQAAEHRIFIGYSLPQGTLHYNAVGMRVDVDE